ncbi:MULTISPECIES: enoyl-CoA hydratase/isomerase family protein [unclassified Nocardia]|uniref:enoyl-CoA hydratase/isomerase family protein n=1 Tax=unclassified Nocardia TaxID=2637762 RepID=UPI0033BA8A60
MTSSTDRRESVESIAGDELTIDRRGAVTIVRLERPQARNALTDRMLRGIGAAVLAAEAGTGGRVLVLTGAGDRSFCSGMDLRAFAEGAQIGYGTDPQTLAYHRLVDRLNHWRSVVFASADAREGAAAFVAKRTPVWQNR